MSRSMAAALAASTLVLAACGGADRNADTARVADSERAQAAAHGEASAQIPGAVGSALKLKLLSSQPQYVSGGDARIHITAPARLLNSVTLWLNGQPLAATLQASGDSLEGVISGLSVGSNLLEARTTTGVRASLTLVNHPITGPMFTGPAATAVCLHDQPVGGGQTTAGGHRSAPRLPGDGQQWQHHRLQP